MKKLLLVAAVMMSGSLVHAKDVSSSNECVDYMNSAFSEASDAVRLEKALLALNLAFDLKLTEQQVAQVEDLVAKKQISQDGLEKMTYFGCTEDMTAEDQKIAQEQFSSILK